MPRRLKLVIAAVLVSAAVILSWQPLGMPPVRLLLRYGPGAGGGQTGRFLTVEGVRFVEIGTGCFLMGSHEDCTPGDLLGRIGKPLGISVGEWPDHDGVECPPRWVEIRSPFWIATTEITNAVYDRFVSDHGRPEIPPGRRYPAVNVSWNDAREFCGWLSDRAGRVCGLPSEAEWEYCCRAGSQDEFCFGDETVELRGYAWFARNSDETAHEVARLRPNAWGLFDLHGNVSEWVEDHWIDDYRDAPADERPRNFSKPDPDPFAREYRVLRGGSFRSVAEGCRAGRSCGWFKLIEFQPGGNSISPGLAPDQSSTASKSPLLYLGKSLGSWARYGMPPLITADLTDESVGFRPVLR